MLKLGIKNGNDEILKAIRKVFTVHEIKIEILYPRMHGNRVSVAGME